MRIRVASPPYAGTRNQGFGVAERLVGERGAIADLRGRDGWLACLPFVGAATACDCLISCSQTGERRARRFLSRLRGEPPVWVQIERAVGEGRAPDLTFLSNHDWRPEDESHETRIRIDGVPHRVRPDALAALRAQLCRADPDRAGVSHTTVLLGGPNMAFDYDDGVLSRLEALVRDRIELGDRVLVSTSRRTPADFAARLGDLAGERLELFDGSGPNPYRRFLALADRLVVAEDSMTMTCEAVATGRPVHTLALSEKKGPRRDKFRRFHDHLRETLRSTRRAEPGLPAFEPRPFDDTGRIAAMIEDRMSGER